MNYSVLEDIGLTRSEVLVYVALLKLGYSSTGKIVKEAKISSGKIYEILDRLIDKGLVSYSIKNNVKYFEAADPSKIKDYLDRKQDEFDKVSSSIKNVIPELKEIKRIKRKEYNVLVYEGFEGLKSVVFGALEEAKAKEWLAMGIITTARDSRINNMWNQWYMKNRKKKLRVKLIISDKRSVAFYKDKKAELRLLKGLTPSPTAIVGNKVMIFDWGKLSVIVIENERIAASFKTFFNSMWAVAKTI